MNPIVEAPVGVKYRKDVTEHILKIETDEFKVCTPKVKKKRKWLFFQQLFVVHVLPDGTINYEELR